MTIEADLISLAQEMAKLEGRFKHSSSSGYFLDTDDEASFKRLVIEAKSIIDSALGHANDFSMNLIHSINAGSGGFIGGPSLAAVKEARQIVEGAINHIRRQPTTGKPNLQPTKTPFVDPSRLAELRAISNPQWHAIRLVRLCEELNSAHELDNYMTVAMLVRTITNHVPPLFGCKTFSEVANNVGGAKSFKQSMQTLDNSLKNIADSLLHEQIRRQDTLPNATQVRFSQDLDVLLAETVRRLRS